MTALTAFYDYILPEVKGLTPGKNALQALRESAIELCELSQIWRHPPAAINSVAGTASYAITVPAESELSEVLWATYNDEFPKLDPMSEVELDEIFPEGWRALQGQVQFYYLTTAGQIRLVRIPDTSITGAIDLEVSLKPTSGTATLQDFLFADWRNEIALGAKARLLGQQGRPWSDPRGALIARQDFMEAIGVAGYVADRSGTRAPIRTKAQYR